MNGDMRNCFSLHSYFDDQGLYEEIQNPRTNLSCRVWVRVPVILVLSNMLKYGQLPGLACDGILTKILINVGDL